MQAALAAMLMIGAAAVQAQDIVPAAINVQGSLYDPSAGGGAGGPLTGVQPVNFCIYDNLTGGTLIWGRTFPVVCNQQGVFNVLLDDTGPWLGGVTNSLRAAFQDANCYIEMTVSNHGSAISPRQQFVSTLYAVNSAHATYADAATNNFQVNEGLQVFSGGLTVAGQATFQDAAANAGFNASSLAAGSATVNGMTASGLTVTSNAQVSGALQVGGRIRDKTGFLVPAGVVLPYAAGSVPDGWLGCNGAAVSRTTYADLFTAIGTNYGSGDGATTFNVPDLQGRTAIGAGQGAGLTNRVPGQKIGEENHTLTPTEMPSHTHSLTMNSDTEGYALVESSHGYWKNTAATATTSTGGGAGHNNMPPDLVLNYFIKY